MSLDQLSEGDVWPGDSALGSAESSRPRVVLVDLTSGNWSAVPDAVSHLGRLAGHIVIGWSDRHLAPESAPLLELLAMTIAPGGPADLWVDPHVPLEQVIASISASPAASLVLLQVLRASAGLAVPEALMVESMAYSTLLAGGDFHDWRASRERRQVPDPETAPVRVERMGEDLHITLSRPGRRNAMDRYMRDGLVDALEVALLDESICSVQIRSDGPAFSSGGDLDEFGSASDVVATHLLRLQQSVGARIDALKPRVTVTVHGACVGAGIEVPAFAGQLIAREDAWFQLPEVRMGLIPGAGGTVSIPRRIGRWRTAYMALTGERISVQQALSWGLVDEVL